MGAQSVLFIGGTGVISSACVRRAVDRGFVVSVLNRGRRRTDPLPRSAMSSWPTQVIVAR